MILENVQLKGTVGVASWLERYKYKGGPHVWVHTHAWECCFLS